MRGVGGGIPLTREEAKSLSLGSLYAPGKLRVKGERGGTGASRPVPHDRPSFTHKALSRIRATHSSQMLSRLGGYAEQMAFQTTLTMGS
jgi:hypothetical protein